MRPSRIPVVGLATVAALSLFGNLAAQAESAPRIGTPWPGIHLVWYDDLQLKSVVAEFEGFLVAVEVPHDDATARALLGLLRERFPDKPLRFAFHTHHHGHSLGALDSLLAADVTVVTSPWNIGALRERSSAPQRFDARVLPLHGELTLEDAANAMTVYVIPQESYEVPTPEYMIAYFPREGAVVSGCLFNKPDTYYEVVNDRKTSLGRFITDRALEVSWIVPTNTTAAAGFEDFSTYTTFTETLERGLKPPEVADQLQARSVEELRQGFAKLVEEFSALTPRSYDILVCAGYLKSDREDYERALLLYEVAAEIFPDEFWPRWGVADCWALLDDTERAREALNRALESATSDAERERVRKRLAEL